LVERNLAKVEVASSRLVSRSKLKKGSAARSRFPLSFLSLLAEWQSGYAAACKAVYLGSIPGSASNTSWLYFFCPTNKSPCGPSLVVA
jgi:hypothetical protein